MNLPWAFRRRLGPKARFLNFQEKVLDQIAWEDPEPALLRGFTHLAWTVHTYGHMKFPNRIIPEERRRNALIQSLRRPVGHGGPYNCPSAQPVFNHAEERGCGPSWHAALNPSRSGVCCGSQDAGGVGGGVVRVTGVPVPRVTGVPATVG